MFPLDDTIVAVASPPGGAARGIVRLSGPRAIEIIGEFLDSPLSHWERARVRAVGDSPLSHWERARVRAVGDSPLSHWERARVRAADGESLPPPPFPCVIAGSLRLPSLHSPLSCDAYLWHDRSYTGQPMAELHTIGSPPLVDLVLHSLCAAGARLAAPGEFTLRAFLAGRIDLTQAEAVLGVIDAADRHDLNVALGQLAGGLARPLHRLSESLLDLLAHVEAGFDFADEDLLFITRESLVGRLAEAERDAAAVERQMTLRGESNAAFKAAIVGSPNSGKSSLFNAMLGDRAALVSDRSGTTRDYLTAELDLGGVRCQLIDTAGTSGEGRVESGEGRVESGEKKIPLAVSQQSGVEAAAQSAAERQRRAADVELFCLDSTRPLDDWELAELHSAGANSRVVVLTKCDLRVPEGDRSMFSADRLSAECVGSPKNGPVPDDKAVETSSLTGVGVETLKAELRRRLLAAGGRGETVAGTALRCGESLRLAGQSLRRAGEVAVAGREELAAAEIRVALDELGKVTGAVYADDVLERIFSRFCVGK